MTRCFKKQKEKGANTFIKGMMNMKDTPKLKSGNVVDIAQYKKKQ